MRAQETESLPEYENALQVKNIDKRYGGVHALKNVTWSVLAGEIHGLVGENGAGKSTLIKMISGAEKPDEGCIYIHGQEINSGDTNAAFEAGVSAVYQEPQVFRNLTVAENIFVGREKKKVGIVDWNHQYEQAEDILRQVSLNPEILGIKVGRLPVGEQQLVAIAKALVTKTKLLILDEPSAILTNDEIDKLFRIVRSLRDKGVGVIYISHRLDEVQNLTNRVTVMRDGEIIGTYKTETMSPTEIAKAMCGDKFKVQDTRESHRLPDVDPLLKVDNLHVTRRLKDVSFELYPGEILGVYGLVGSGTSELVRGIFGIQKIDSGEVRVNGNKIQLTSPQKAMLSGISMLPGNRKTQGVFLPKSLSFNMSSSHLKFFSKFGFFRYKKERQVMLSLMDKLRIKAPSPETHIGALSGGNQQKVVMAKQLVEGHPILLVEEPTQGVDVGAKREIHDLIINHVSQGNSALVVSTDLEEICYLADRILVIYHGTGIKIFEGGVDAATLLAAACGDIEQDGE